MGRDPQALAAAQTAIRRFEAAGVPWLRPYDYYAEMVKSDEHMAKVGLHVVLRTTAARHRDSQYA